jgi:hypothetical protein
VVAFRRREEPREQRINNFNGSTRRPKSCWRNCLTPGKAQQMKNSFTLDNGTHTGPPPTKIKELRSISMTKLVTISFALSLAVFSINSATAETLSLNCSYDPNSSLRDAALVFRLDIDASGVIFDNANLNEHKFYSNNQSASSESWYRATGYEIVFGNRLRGIAFSEEYTIDRRTGSFFMKGVYSPGSESKFAGTCKLTKPTPTQF